MAHFLMISQEVNSFDSRFCIAFLDQSIPSIAKTMGKAIYQIRNVSDDIKDEIKKSGGDIKKDLNISELVKETEEEIKVPMDQMLTDIKHIKLRAP